jgi:hypothetical protein
MKVHQLITLLREAPPFAEVVIPEPIDDYVGNGIKRVIVLKDEEIVMLEPNNREYELHLNDGETFLYDEKAK